MQTGVEISHLEMGVRKVLRIVQQRFQHPGHLGAFSTGSIEGSQIQRVINRVWIIIHLRTEHILRVRQPVLGAITTI